MKKLVSLMIIAMLMLMVTPVLADEHEETIVDIAVASDDFNTLVAALTEADLVDILEGEGPFTVFAPTDAAFEDLLDELGIEAEDLLAHPQLNQVLRFHVVESLAMSGDLEDGMVIPTLEGESVVVDLSDGVKINESTVTDPDIEAANGVIHVIDKVLVPVSFDPDYEEHEEVPATGTSSVYPIAALIVVGLGSLIAGKQLLKQNK